MPGAYKSLFVVAFDLDRTGQAVPAFEPRQAPDDETAIAQARRLAESHAGAVAWKREAKPVVGEEGEPVVIWQAGSLGDFN
ncbi:hypothetical protein AAIH70_20960 [Neorhizobium sp. BT27B]|uniref:hypothetical protein n=1 Tax=Neorhizobium sp. BT27B TaxID=3142625 RepID=UPI003D2844F0